MLCGFRFGLHVGQRAHAVVGGTSAIASASAEGAAAGGELVGPPPCVVVRGARQHNLKGIDVDVPLGAMTAVCGVSGSGKSSLSYHTLYAAGQRRYVETFSSYARQFLERLPEPAADRIAHVPPSLAIGAERVRTSRANVASLTEVLDHMCLIYAHCSELLCEGCGAAVVATTPSSAAQMLAQWAPSLTWHVGYALAEGVAAAQLIAAGTPRIWSGGAVFDLRMWPEVLGQGEPCYCIVDRVRGDRVARMSEAFEQARSLGDGDMVAVALTDSVLETVPPGGVVEQHGRGVLVRFSSKLACLACERTYPRLAPGQFSWNSPRGACPACRGFGSSLAPDLRKLVPDDRLSLSQGAIGVLSLRTVMRERRALRKYLEAQGICEKTPWRDLSEAVRNALLLGDSAARYPGVVHMFKRLARKAHKTHVRIILNRFRSPVPCSTCGGSRLKPSARAWRFAGLDLPTALGHTVSQLRALFDGLPKDVSAASEATAEAVAQVRRRLAVLEALGLGYLELDRQARTLSAGELQRVRLAAATASALVGVLYVLDEPSTALHALDIGRLTGVLDQLVERGNTVVVVEHDADMIRQADHVIELGPGAGSLGGEVIYCGQGSLWSPPQLGHAERAPAAYEQRGVLRIRGARMHNLKSIDVDIPLGRLVGVCGVSGSGKSSLVLDELVSALRWVGGDRDPELAHTCSLEGFEGIDRVVVVDQSPVARGPRSCVATYTKVWDAVRALFAQTDVAMARGWGAGVFSFNVPGGRCEVCEGAGAELVDMQFLADVCMVCEACGGQRFQDQVLTVEVEGLNIACVLALSLDEVADWLGDRLPRLRTRIAWFQSLGLGYLRLGQSLATVSGGEAQRLKLIRELLSTGAARRGHSLVVLDEPTRGLHTCEVALLIRQLRELVSSGHSVVVVEHHLQVLRAADWLVDLGPGGGPDGGTVLYSGSPPSLVASGDSPTALALRAAEAAVPPRARVRRASRLPDMRIRGAREHNLRIDDLTIPQHQLVCVSGVSGSGKSSLVRDILFAEGRRRYVEALAVTARQALPKISAPDVRSVDGLAPAVHVSQRLTKGGAHSTVGTLTGVYHYLRLLYAKVATPVCARCKRRCEVTASEHVLESVREQVQRLSSSRVLRIMAPLIRARKGRHEQLLERMVRDARVVGLRVDGAFVSTTSRVELAVGLAHDIDAVVARLRNPASADELARAVTAGLSLGGGTLLSSVGGDEVVLSTQRACPGCGLGVAAPDPLLFSFFSKRGQCRGCKGTGHHDADEPTRGACKRCGGSRLRPEALRYDVGGATIAELAALHIEDLLAFVTLLPLSGTVAAELATPILKELTALLTSLVGLGTDYLGLDRRVPTLSGGELQRLRLAAQLAQARTNTLVVLDEPTIGLHAADREPLVRMLGQLRTAGNSVVVVEHEAQIIRAADWVIDLGPGAGKEGGRVVASGSPAAIAALETSPTGRALAAPLHSICGLERKEPGGDGWLSLEGASRNNLQAVDVRFPRGCLSVVTGVSGSGKSTLVNDTLAPAVQATMAGELSETWCRSVAGAEEFQRVVAVDQSPVGRTPRSAPVTYLKLMDRLRNLFAATTEAKMHGFGRERFSFNRKSGCCEICAGVGLRRFEMAFLPDAAVVCDACDGQRFNEATLAIRFMGLSIADMLALTIAEANSLLGPSMRWAKPLAFACETGLGYLKLGQSLAALSGGEAQRLKLAAELGSCRRGLGLYLLDEPTTGLHRSDVALLIRALRNLVDQGHSVIVIEHDLDVIAGADWVVDLGPGAGACGGRVLFSGSADGLAEQLTPTGSVLASHLAGPQ